MRIVKADTTDLSTVRELTQLTIFLIYRHYYPAGAVEYFMNHHSEERISDDIRGGNVYLCLSDSGEAVGTVTVSGNEISRLFVMYSEQGQGYGRALLDFAEELIAQQYDTAVLASSLPAKAIYKKRGYIESSFNTINTDDDVLCYDMMTKKLK